MKSIQILDRIVPSYTEKFLSGQYSLDEMPLLEAIGNLFSKPMESIDSSNTYIIACQHILKPQFAMFTLLVKLGILPSHILILPKIYSANQKVSAELKKLGCKMFEDALTFQPWESFDAFHAHQCNKMVEYVSKNVPRSARLVILDDGGMLIKAFAENKTVATSFMNGVYGVEQTASGRSILSKLSLPFLVTNVAGSIEKITIETDYIIRHSMIRSENYLSEHNIINTAKVLVLGQGPIGKALVASLTQKGYSCRSYDIIDGKFSGKLSAYDVIFGATGSNSITAEQLDKLKENVHLISVSSSDREFPAVHVRTHSISGKNVHDTFVYEKKNIHLANGGFPITFKGCEIECYPLEMDVTKMKLAEAILLHLTGKTEFSTTLNEFYVIKLLKTYKKIVIMWAILMTLFAVVKDYYFGFWMVPPPPIGFTAGLLTLLSCYPMVAIVIYFRQLERISPECSL